MKHVRMMMLAAGLLVGALAAPVADAATCPSVGVLPKTFPEGIKVQPYTITKSEGSPATVEACVYLENTSLVTVPAVGVDSQLEEPGTGVPGPWPLISSSSINIGSGASVTCSTASNVATTTATFGSLAPGEITDICCFTWQEEPFISGCSALPESGDLARHTFVSGTVVTMPIFWFVPVGGTTCGLVSLELLVVLPLLRLARRRIRR